MSTISQFGESSPNQVYLRQWEYPESDSIVTVRVPHTTESGSQNGNASDSDIPIANGHESKLPNVPDGREECFDSLIFRGEIRTMDFRDVSTPRTNLNAAAVARTYSNTQESTDPETHLIHPTAYLESIPGRPNLFGIPGEIDN